MKPECVQAVSRVLGREATTKELTEIEKRITKHARELKGIDRNTLLSMSPEQRMAHVAETAAKGYVSDVAMKARRKVMSARAIISAKAFIDAQPEHAVERLRDMVSYTAYDRRGVQSIESRTLAVSRSAFGQMLDTLKVTHPKALGLFNNDEGAMLLLKELHGEDSGSPEAKAAAKAFQDVAENLRQRFNRGGGDVGRLEDWGMPHHHSQYKVARTKVDKWVSDILPKLNREKYFNEDGTRMSDDEVRAVLRGVHETISTGGANKRARAGAKASSGRGGSRANNNSESRSVHFKDSQSYAEYWKEYGESSMLDIITSHIQGMSRDISLIEQFGPDADNTYRQLMDYAIDKEKITVAGGAQQLAEKGKRGGSTDAVGSQKSKIDLEYRYASGQISGASHKAFADVMRGVRSLNVASKLGSAYITSVTDYGTMALTAGYNNIPFRRVVDWEMSLMNPKNAEHRDFARRQGLGIETMISAGNRFDGFADATGSDGKMAAQFADAAGRLAQSVMRASGLAFATDIRRAGFSMTMMDSIGTISRKASMADISPDDAARLRGFGVTDTDFALWHAAKPVDVRGQGDTVLTADAIMDVSDADVARITGRAVTPESAETIRTEAATRLMAIVSDESRMAIIEPGIRERVMMYGETDETSAKGLLLKSFWQFKSFGVSMMLRHLGRMASMNETRGKAASIKYGVALATTTTMLGALALQMNEIAKGKDPRAMDESKFWGAAFMKGGALGLLGDLLYGGETAYGSSAASVVLGPTAGIVLEPAQIAGESVRAGWEGKPSDLEGNLVRYAKGNIPGQSMWYAKAALDHLVWHDMMEATSPGYLARMTRRSRQQFGQEYFWKPGENTPSRGPDFEAMAGE